MIWPRLACLCRCPLGCAEFSKLGRAPVASKLLEPTGLRQYPGLLRSESLNQKPKWLRPSATGTAIVTHNGRPALAEGTGLHAPLRLLLYIEVAKARWDTRIDSCRPKLFRLFGLFLLWLVERAFS